MQLSDMVARVSARLAEGSSGPVYYPKAEIVAALNEANRFFVLLTLGLETTAPWTVTAATTFFHMLTVFGDWVAPLRITDATGAKIRPARIEELTGLDFGWMASPGAPSRYCAMGADFLALYQQPAVDTVVNVTYARAPLPLVNDADVPETPGEYHPSYVGYAINRLRQAEGAQEFEKSLPYFDGFLEAAKHYGAYVRARNLGARYDKVPFELESFDRSELLNLRKDLMPAGPERV
jgi:hypothetical protein